MSGLPACGDAVGGTCALSAGRPSTTLSTTLRRGWSSCPTAFPPTTARTITDEALSEILMGRWLPLPAAGDLRSPSAMRPMPYTLVGLSGCSPDGLCALRGSQAEVCYGPLLTVEGF